MKVVKKVNHDSLWLRVGVVGNYSKVLINRSGVKIITKGKLTESISEEMRIRFKELDIVKNTYGDVLDIMEKEFTIKYVK